MWSELDLERMEREENAYAGYRTPEEVEQMVVIVRLELYNRGKLCGPTAVRTRLHGHYALKPLPAERSIARMLARHGLSHARTGCPDTYAGPINKGGERDGKNGKFNCR